ncbi:hypothetical protein BBK14_30515 [Parafrankia soli]|uniref:SWIM-type domain-containing protein n=1 Tax=Parafrankia soli TaxID=2599596 RepID=A0A1S1RGM0_9ACTN|nr:DUF5691 domain-containing protein [Parafrankia soli]OHV45246.1 hypothetical protein BBK14_30515 [Parafrankia soli]
MSNTTSPPVERGQALALAPDQASVKAGERLAVAGSWPLAGGDAEALWGECRGSGKSPYRVVVALADHASKCSCPSRKFPCKHALGLMLLAAAGGVAGAGEVAGAGGGRPPWAAEWLDRRVARFAAAASAGTRAATGPESERSAAGAARREVSRAAKVDGGVAELARWLSDLAGEGLGAAQARPADWWRAAAARMVDAQAPGLAEMIHEAAQIAGSAARRPDWPSRLVDRVGLLHLLCEGWARRADLPADVVAVLRDRIGFTVPVATVLAGEHVVGEVDVLGAHEFGAGRARGRRQWLRLVESGRLAVLVDFAVNGQGMPPPLPAGSRVRADLAPYPGRRPARVAPGAPGGAAAVVGPVDTDLFAPTWRAALAGVASALAVDPFADVVALTVRGVTVLPPGAGAGPLPRSGPWLLRDSAGEALPLADEAVAEWGWHMLAAGGGAGLDVVAEWDSFTLTPLAATPSRTARAEDMPGRAPVPVVAAPVAPVPTPGWTDLVDAAVIGVSRRPSPVIPGLPDPGGRPGEEERLLRVAALAAVTRRAGQLAADASTVPAPAPAAADEHPPCPPTAVVPVPTEVGAAETAELEEWLDLLAEGGWRPPDTLLPALVELGRRSTALRPRLLRVLGPRGRWFAALHPDAGWAGPVGVAGWPSASAQQRRSLIAALRHTDPAAAAELLRGGAGEPPFVPFRRAGGAERLAFVQALRTGLGPYDEELLEAALDDRRSDVRDAAVQVLLELPGTRFAARAAARTERAFTVHRGTLRVHPPAVLTDEMARDGVSPDGPSRARAQADGPARMLLAEIARVDPRLWPERTGLSPQKFLSARALWEPAPSFPALTLAPYLVGPVVRHRDPEWALALIPKVEPRSQGVLIGCLPEPDRLRAFDLALSGTGHATRRWGLLLGRSGGHGLGNTALGSLITLLAGIPGPWSAEFTRAAGPAITAIVTAPVDEPGSDPQQRATARTLHARVRALLANLAWRVEPYVGIPDLDPSTMPAETVSGYQRLAAVLAQRRARRDTLLSRSSSKKGSS